MTTTPQDVIDAAIASHAKFYPMGPFVSVNLGQWALESDYGKYVSGKNNFFGIKANRPQILNGQSTLRWTHETINGVYEMVRQYFADYPSLSACFDAHATLLTDPRMEWAYGDCWRAQTPDDYARALGEHYATGMPGHPYSETLIAVMKANNYYQFDPPPPAAKLAGSL